VASCGAPTGFDSGEPRWRRKMAKVTNEPTARNSDCQFWSVASQKLALPTYDHQETVVSPCAC
jgi:hypothetical protein